MISNSEAIVSQLVQILLEQIETYTDLTPNDLAILTDKFSELADAIVDGRINVDGLDTNQILQTLYAYSVNLTVVGTPASDTFQTGARGLNFILGRDGNDVVLAVDDSQDLPGRREFDFLDGGNGRDRFILGDRRTAFYNSGNANFAGDRDYGLVLGFRTQDDIIQLHGSAANYTLQVDGTSTNIFLLGQNNSQELIGTVSGVTGLSLNAPYFKYVSGDAPAPVVGLINQYGNRGQNIPWNIAIANDDSGDVYATGTTAGNVGGPSAGSLDGYLLQFNQIGVRGWSKQLGTTEIDNIYGVNTNTDGDVYFVGRTKGSLVAPNAGIGNDIVFGKYDSDGNEQWIQQFGSFGVDNSFVNPELDASGNVYVGGYTDGSLFGPNAGAAFPPSLDPWVAKFDPDGNQLWARQFGSPTGDELFGLDVDSQGNVLATGWTFGGLAGPNNVNVDGAATYDIWLQKMDTNGNTLWTEQFGTNVDDWAWDIETNAAGEIYLTGWTLGNLGGTNAGSYDYYIAKYSSSGDQLWVRQYGTTGDDAATRMALDDNGNIYLTGYSNGPASGQVFGTSGGYDAWVAKFDSEGNSIWRKTIGTVELDQAFGIAVQGNDLLVSGLTEGSLGAVNQGSYDGWIARLTTTTGNLLSFNGLG